MFLLFCQLLYQNKNYWIFQRELYFTVEKVKKYRNKYKTGVICSLSISLAMLSTQLIVNLNQY